MQKMQSMTANLFCGHWIELPSIKDIDEILYYIKISSSNNLSKR